MSSTLRHPSSVVALCKELYSVEPQCWLLEIRGYKWEMEEKLSEGAQENLRRAIKSVVPLLENRNISEIS